MKVSICGCGWLGEPLALHLLDLGYEVFGSKTSQDGVNKSDSEELIAAKYPCH